MGGDSPASPQVRAELLRVAIQRIAKLQKLTEGAGRSAGASVMLARCGMTSERSSPLNGRHSGTATPRNRRLSALLNKSSLLNRASSPLRARMASAEPSRPPATCLPPPICASPTPSVRPSTLPTRQRSFSLSSARWSLSPKLPGSTPRPMTQDRLASGDTPSRSSSITTVQRLQSLRAKSPIASEISTSPQQLCSPFKTSSRISSRSCSPDETGWGREVGGEAAGEAEGGDGGALGGGLDQQLCDLDRELEVALEQSGDRQQVGNYSYRMGLRVDRQNDRTASQPARLPR